MGAAEVGAVEAEVGAEVEVVGGTASDSAKLPGLQEKWILAKACVDDFNRRAMPPLLRI